MRVMAQRKEIVGTLYAQGQKFDLLDLHPTKHNDWPWLIREHGFEFYVVVDGFAQYIMVSRGSFLIIPDLEPSHMDVKFLVENIKVEESEE